MLDAGDAGTGNVIVDDTLRQAPLRLRAGDRITVIGPSTERRETLTVVGFYRGSGAGANLNLAPVLGAREVTRAVGGTDAQAAFYLQVDPTGTAEVTDALTAAVPRAQIINFGDLIGQFGQVLNNLLLLLTAIASLALLTGIVIIANAVALAMLERRRELGIMKAVGYTGGRVLGVVLIENGLIGAVGGLLGMLLVGLAVAAINELANLALGASPALTLGIIASVTAVAMLVALIVAWGAARVRPVAVLRYEG